MKAPICERIGAEKVKRLVAAFCSRADYDPVIRPLYGNNAFLRNLQRGPHHRDETGFGRRRRMRSYLI
jgi:truncated hemoglobin YjbI